MTVCIILSSRFFDVRGYTNTVFHSITSCTVNSFINTTVKTLYVEAHDDLQDPKGIYNLLRNEIPYQFCGGISHRENYTI